MSGRLWRWLALALWFDHVIRWSIPWFIDHWGMPWGVVAATVVGVLAVVAVLIPVREKDATEDKVDASLDGREQIEQPDAPRE